MPKISIDEFKKVEIRVGEIRSAEKVLDADKLLRLMVSFGDEERQVVSGIAAYFPNPTDLIGKCCLFVTNLEYRTIRGFESQAMIMATGGEPLADGSGNAPLYLFETTTSLGSRVR
jgi:methionyl-tRNA synthetase